MNPRAIHVGVDSAAAGGGRPPIKESTASRDPIGAEEWLPGAGKGRKLTVVEQERIF